MDLEQRLSSFTALPPEQMIEKIQDVIEDVCASSTISNMNQVIAFLLSNPTRIPNNVVKTCLLHLATAISPIKNNDTKEVATFALEEIKKSTSPFDEPDFALREALFSYFVSLGMWTEAAEILGNANIESSAFTDNKKADLYIKCAEAYLEDGAGFEAENFVNKASSFMKSPDVKQALELQLRYRVVFARVLDSNKKFTDAALRYYHLSKTEGELEVDEDDLLDLFGKAMACAILGKIGPQRSRVLQLIVADPRLQQIAALKPKYEAHASLLMKMSSGNLIQPSELGQFTKSLPPHQNAGAGNGFSLPENAVIEHNLFMAGNVYDNISMKELSKLLTLDEVSAERVTCRMISEGRLEAVINQEDGFLYFNVDDESTTSKWDDLNNVILSICDEVNECVELIQANRIVNSLPSD